MPMWFDLTHFDVFAISLISTFLMCSALGVERQLHHKDAGVKTHVLVGIGACIFTIVSAYGFSPVLGTDVRLDPSRIAAQIVSGIGFLGAGVIFVNNDTVRGLTTAATIWVSAAIGMACGAYLIPVALLALFLHYLTIFLIGPLVRKFSPVPFGFRVVLTYVTGRGVMRRVLTTSSSMGFKATIDSTKRIKDLDSEYMRVVMQFDGRGHRADLMNALSALRDVHTVEAYDGNTLD